MRRSDQPQSLQRQNLLLLVVARDVARGGERTCVPRQRLGLGLLRVVAGFQVSINGRIWVFTEVMGGSLRTDCAYDKNGTPEQQFLAHTSLFN
jgi:hypothetical protein